MTRPANPMQPGYRGQSMAMAGHAIATLAGWPMRLLWCVDLARDVGPAADRPLDPSAPGKTQWGVYLTRLRTALEAQPHTGDYDARIGLCVRYTTQGTGEVCTLTFDLPWRVNYALIAKAPPPIGSWRLMFEPQRMKGHYHGHTNRDNGMPFEGDTLPDTFWSDGIPF